MLTILGIETSCDETAASVVRRHEDGTGDILSDVVHSQIDDHAAYGGVVPEIAARAHVEKLDAIVSAALHQAQTDWDRVDAIAATTGPGLIGGLIVGTMTAKAIAWAQDKPFFAINHLEGHALTARLTDNLTFPYLLLLVSGGHTQIILVRGLGRYERWASTIDDALGEAFDKTAKLLGLPYPGGPAVEAAAMRGNPMRFSLPHPLKGEDRPDFSFSGLKTALRRQAQSLVELDETAINDLCASFQHAVVETMKDRVSRSLLRYRNEIDDDNPVLVVAGGVAANKTIRSALVDICGQNGFSLSAPPMNLCTDNAAMIAWAALEHMAVGNAPEPDAVPRPRWPLDQMSEPVFGSGRKGAKA